MLPPAFRWSAVCWLGAWVGVLAGAALPLAGSAREPDLGGADQVEIPGIVRELGARLQIADRLAAESRWQEAVDACLELVRDHGDDLAPVDPAAQPLATGQRFVQARWLASQRIAAWGAPAWQAYRNRVEGAAKKQLDVATAARDPRQLRRVVEEAFCSRAAEKALEQLGDLAFERGDFAEAQLWWRLLARPATDPAAGDKQAPLTFPDPSPETVARVRARQIVCLLFEERADRVADELKAFRLQHGTASGNLAGGSGNYADLIQALWQEGQGTLPPGEQEWPTFAGAFSRQRTLPFALSTKTWADGPAWRVRLDSGEVVPASVAAKASAKVLPAQLAFHPVIAAAMAHVADVRFVRGFSLRTGQLRYQFDLAEARGLAPPDAAPVKVPVPAEVRYTLTVSQGHVFACLGDLYARPAAADAKRAECWLVCLRLPETGPAPAVNAAQLKRWAVPATHKSADRLGFEGAPVVIGDSVFVVRQHQVGTQTTATLCCFAADTGEPRWEQVLCETVDLARVEQQRRRPALLTQAGPLLIYCSHAGAVVAVEADSGKRAWAIRYASRAVRDREPCPPLAVDRSVIVAPVDLGRLLCLDAATGQTVWERSPVEVSQLLGVCQGRLVFTTATGLRAVLADSGADAGGWSQPALGSLPGCGRGLIAGGWVFWPTVDAHSPYRAVHALDGGLIRGTQNYEPGQLQALPPGNLAYGQGCLVIATGEELWGYTVPAPPAGKPDT